ncbi:MAG: NUDIX hydrolase [Parcubacteria group bacterium]|nr:NUDIX hydrolase [Parcubacteria group bacterium]
MKKPQASKYKKYDYAVIATDVALFTVRNRGLQVLLIKMKKEPYTGKWAMPGGLVKANESVDNAAERILREKGGVRNVYLEQLHTFGRVDRDPFGRVVSVAYTALVPSTKLSLKTTEEYADITWFPVKDAPALAYDHREILETAVERLRAKLGYTNIAQNLLPSEFTLSELQSVYEVVLGKKLDKRNFRKKILAIGLVKGTGKERRGQASRPAELYSFRAKKMKTIEIL